MKKRVSKSELHFYIQKLTKQGFKRLSTVETDGLLKIVLKREKELITITYTSNGWLNLS